MRLTVELRSVVLVVLLGSSHGCGGISRSDGVQQTGGGSAGVPPAGSGGSALSVPIGDGGSYPAVPAGSSSFFWRWGLGNWFVSTSDGRLKDASRRVVDDVAEYDANDVQPGVGVGVDLWAQLNHPVETPIDLSAYEGISFDVNFGGIEPLAVVFDATGSVIPGETALPAQMVTERNSWQTHSVRFADVGYDASAARSIDFIVLRPGAGFRLAVRNLALLCSQTCP